MKYDRKWKRAGVLILTTAVVLGGVPEYGLFAVQAAQRESAVTEYDEETLARLRDHVLEYEEIPGLIEQYNMTFRNQLESFYYNPDGSMGLTKEQLLSLAGELREEAEILSEEAEDMKPDIGRKEYEEYQANIRALKSYAKSLEDASEGKSSAGASAIRGLRITRNQQTKAACEKMRKHQALAEQDELSRKRLEIAELTYEGAKRQMELGIYSAENVLSAEEALNSARAAAAADAAALKSGRQDLLLMLGWSYDAEPEIRPVPEPDLSRIASFNPEADSLKAIENNITLYDTRMTSSSSFGSADAKARQVQEEENKVKMNMTLLYQDALQKRAAYQAAATEFEAARANKEAADRKNSLGMLSRQQYLTEEVTYLTAKASMTSAGLDLTAAIEEYEWAVKGLLELGTENQQ